MRYDQLNMIAERHERLFALLRQGKLSSRGLSQELGVSEPTIYRDIDYLRKQGHNIRAVRISRAWAYQLATDSGESYQEIVAGS